MSGKKSPQENLTEISEKIKGSAQREFSEAKDSLMADINEGGFKKLIKNKYFIGVVGLLSVFIFIAISSSGGTPKGTDSVVKKTVIEIAMKELKKQITPAIYTEVTKVPVGLIGLQVTYDDLVKNIDQDDNRKVVNKIDEKMKTISMSLSNIRTKEINEDIKKSTSSADLKINEKTIPITYTAQRNNDGDVYVEVFGL